MYRPSEFQKLWIEHQLWVKQQIADLQDKHDKAITAIERRDLFYKIQGLKEAYNHMKSI
jgi:hypothetical protein